MDIVSTIRDRLDSVSAQFGETFSDLLKIPSRRSLFAFTGYFLYGLLVFAIVFTSKFIEPRIEPVLREKISQLQGIRLDFPKLDVTLLPPKVATRHLAVYDKASKQKLVQLSDVTLDVSLFSLVTGRGGVSLTANAYGGKLHADWSTGFLYNPQKASADIELDMVELERIPQIKEYDKTLKGIASLNLAFAGEPANPLQMEGEIEAKIDQLYMENRFPVIKGARLKGFGIDLDGTFEEGQLALSKLNIADEQGISLKTEGQVVFDQQEFGKSELNMKGRFIGPVDRLAKTVLDPRVVKMLNNKQAVPVIMTGVIGRPAIVLR